VPAWDVIVASALGPAVAIALGIMWSRAGQHVRRRTFAQVTAIFLCVLFLQLAIDGLHEVAEAYVFSGAEALHNATEAFSSDGAYGQYTQFLLIAVPVAWWLAAIFWEHGKGSDRSAVDVGR
jgi:high-affinity Fe2+/Pb2+ permease